MPTYASSDLANVGMRPEAAEGTLDVAGAYPKILTTGLTVDFSSTTVQDDTITGGGEVIDVRTTSRGVSVTTPAKLRYFDCRPLIGPAFRAVYPSEVTVVGSSNVNALTAGTHLDGSTGPQLRFNASTTALDTLINYDGANATTHPRGGAESLMAAVTGSATAANNQLRRIKAVWKDATHSYIDFYPGYVGASGGTFGAPMVGTTGESITVRVGSAVRNRLTGAGVKGYSMLVNYSDMAAAAGWQAFRGLVAGDPTLSWTGKEGAMISVPWTGYGSLALDNADPTSQGFSDPNLFSEMMIGGEDLKFFAIVTSVKPIILTGANLTSFNGQLAGNNQAVDDVSGTDEVVGVVRGTHVPTGSIGWYLFNDARAEEITALGDKATAAKGIIDIVFQDRAGNRSIWGWLNNEFAPSGPSPGGTGGKVSGTLNFAGSRKNNTARSVVHQEFVVV